MKLDSTQNVDTVLDLVYNIRTRWIYMIIWSENNYSLLHFYISTPILKLGLAITRFITIINHIWQVLIRSNGKNYMWSWKCLQ